MSPGTIRVRWSPPTEGAPVIGYRVNYTSKRSPKFPASTRSKTVNRNYFSVVFTGLSDDGSYTITVETESKHLSGISTFSTETKSEPTPGVVTGDMNSTLHGDMNSTSHGDMKNSTLHGEIH